MKELNVCDAEFEEMVLAEAGRPVTTSLRVAKYFGKAHGKVLRAIELLACSAGFNRANFGLIEYIDSRGRVQKAYQMTKDGWMFLVMGFTGAKAAEIKEKFIAAFNWMADQLLKRSMDYDHIRNELMLEYQQEKGLASLAGRTLQRWQEKKPLIEGKILSVEADGQYCLFRA